MHPRHPYYPAHAAVGTPVRRPRQVPGSRLAHYPLPTRWLMTDERMGDDLWRALGRVPRGGGVVFRHYSLAPAERRRLFARVRRVASLRGLLLIRAGDRPMPGEMGTHAQRGRGVITWPVHSIAEAQTARRTRADLVFVSPVFATRSHAGAAGISPRRAHAIGRAAGVPIVALGGMTERRFCRLHGFHGYAAIDAWLT